MVKMLSVGEEKRTHLLGVFPSEYNSLCLPGVVGQLNLVSHEDLNTSQSERSCFCSESTVAL